MTHPAIEITQGGGLTVVSGDTETIINVFFGPRQYDAHCMGWRWELYMRDARRAEAAMREEGRRMIAQARALRDAREQFQQAAE